MHAGHAYGICEQYARARRVGGRKNFINFIFIKQKDFMTIAIDYILLVGFSFAFASGLYLGLKSIKLI